MPVKYPNGGGGSLSLTDLTLSGNLVVEGNTTLGNGASDAVNVYGIITFTNGGTVTASSYQLGRLAAGGFQFNVPAGFHQTFTVQGNTILDVFSNGVFVTPVASDGISPIDFKVVSAAHINIPATTNSPSIWFDTSATRTWATGNVAFQGEIFIEQPTYAAVGASIFSSTTTLWVEGPPIAGSNVTFTFSSAVTIQGGTENKNTAITLNLIPPGLANSVGAIGGLGALIIGSTAPISLGDQTATLTSLAHASISSATYISAGGSTRTVTLATGLTVRAPTAGANVTFTESHAVHVINSARFDGRILASRGTGIPSANDLTLGTDGNSWVITGSTQLNGIATAGWRTGSWVVLQFTGALTIAHNTAAGAGFASFNLNTSANITTANGTVVGFMYDGTVWQQLFIKAA